MRTDNLEHRIENQPMDETEKLVWAATYGAAFAKSYGATLAAIRQADEAVKQLRTTFAAGPAGFDPSGSFGGQMVCPEFTGSPFIGSPIRSPQDYVALNVF